MDRNNLRHILTRLAIAVLFLGFGIWEIIQPGYWVAFVPTQLASLGAVTLVTVHGIILLAIGLAVLLGIYLRIAAILATLVMIEIMATLVIESGFTDLVIRDAVVLILAASMVFDDTRYLTFTK